MLSRKRATVGRTLARPTVAETTCIGTPRFTSDHVTPKNLWIDLKSEAKQAVKREDIYKFLTGCKKTSAPVAYFALL
ncbi:hypothetical protein Lche_2541 [Legionella cherrii]|uniref:Uncharacterized protein n=1 Tax=Legionella cherrii TaxID=28084 RepID=A0A0W0SBN9_9GAMM|nr:hypothetical protein Lche_2541 [Legionella cherrii]